MADRLYSDIKKGCHKAILPCPTCCTAIHLHLRDKCTCPILSSAEKVRLLIQIEFKGYVISARNVKNNPQSAAAEHLIFQFNPIRAMSLIPIGHLNHTHFVFWLKPTLLFITPRPEGRGYYFPWCIFNVQLV